MLGIKAMHSRKAHRHQVAWETYMQSRDAAAEKCQDSVSEYVSVLKVCP